MLAITGSSGWIGTNAINYYQNLVGKKNISKYIIPYTSNGRELNGLDTFPLEQIQKNKILSGIFHTAFIRKALIKNYKIKDYIKINRSITSALENALHNNPGIPIISISSGAAANIKSNENNLTIDPYGYLKKEEEIKLFELAKNRMVVVFRVYAATGPFLKLPTHYAFGQFLENIIKKQPIKINSNSLVYRSYVYLPDLIKLSFSIFNKPLKNGFYLIDACTNTLEIGDIASIIKRNFEGITIHRNKIIDSTNNYIGDNNQFLKLLSNYKIKPTPLEKQIKKSLEEIIL